MQFTLSTFLKAIAVLSVIFGLVSWAIRYYPKESIIAAVGQALPTAVLLFSGLKLIQIDCRRRDGACLLIGLLLVLYGLVITLPLRIN